MANIVFNIAKGMVNYYATLPAANDALVLVPIEATGIEADATLKDYDTLAAILAAANNEETTLGRKTLTSVASNVDDTNDRREADAADVTWTAATGNPIAAVIICYDPDTTGGTDADLIPLVKLDASATPAGGDIVGQFNVSGFYRAS